MELGANLETGVVGGGGFIASLLGWALKALHADYKTFRSAAWKRIDELSDSIQQHQVYDAQTYVARTEMNELRNHIDMKFDNLTAVLMGIQKNKN